MSTFSKKLSALMKETGTPQGQLSTFLGVKQQTVSRYMKGQREPNLAIALAIAKYFDVTLEYLISADD